METRVFTAHIPLDLAEKVDAMAERLERPRGWIVKKALAAWIADEEEKHRLTLEGLAAVDAGDFVEDAVVQAWIKSLATGKSASKRKT